MFDASCSVPPESDFREGARGGFAAKAKESSRVGDGGHLG